MKALPLGDFIINLVNVNLFQYHYYYCNFMAMHGFALKKEKT